MAGVAAVASRAASKRVEAMVGEVQEEIEPAARLQLAMAQVVMPANDYLITGDPGEREE